MVCVRLLQLPGPGDGTPTTMGTPGGEYPFWVVIQGTGEYDGVCVEHRDRRDRCGEPGLDDESHGPNPRGCEPLKMTMNKAQTRLYVAEI